MQIPTGAFSQLTRQYMELQFNPKTPDADDVRYFSYGATCRPNPWSMFRQSHRIVEQDEGMNDGLVSVESSKWGTYKGTLVDVSHLDLINWTNRIKLLAWRLMGNERKFNAIAFYLDIAGMSLYLPSHHGVGRCTYWQQKCLPKKASDPLLRQTSRLGMWL